MRQLSKALVSLAMILLATCAKANDDALELLRLAVQCGPGIGLMGDIVFRTEYHLTTDNARRYRLEHRHTQAVHGKEETFLGYDQADFSQIASVSISNPEWTGFKSATTIQLICRRGKKCFETKTFDNPPSHESESHINLCDLQSANNAVIALKELIKINADASDQAADEAEGDCVVADPTGTPLNVRISPNGKLSGSTLANGASVKVVSTSKDAKGRDWAKVSKDGREAGFVFKKYVMCQ